MICLDLYAGYALVISSLSFIILGYLSVFMH